MNLVLSHKIFYIAHINKKNCRCKIASTLKLYDTIIFFQYNLSGGNSAVDTLI